MSDHLHIQQLSDMSSRATGLALILRAILANPRHLHGAADHRAKNWRSRVSEPLEGGVETPSVSITNRSFALKRDPVCRTKRSSSNRCIWPW